MQRRPTAMYFAFFLVIGIGAVALRGAAETQQRVNGLWGVAIISIVAAIVLLGSAYLPTKG